jgi:hypothetical protein
MIRLLIIVMVLTAGLVRPAAALPDEWTKAVIQLADAAGILSSRSCRDGESSDRAAQVLSYLLNQASQNKHLNYAEWREYSRNWVIPSIRATRGLTHSSRDCETARQIIGKVIAEWEVPSEIVLTGTTAAQTLDVQRDGTLPGAPMLGATKSDTLRDDTSK